MQLFLRKINSSPKILLGLLFALQALIVTAGIISVGDIGHKFESGLIPSGLSFFQLIIIALLSWRIFVHASSDISYRKKSCILWAIVAFCFLYISLDEIFEIHIMLKHLIYHLLNLQDNFFTARIDDLIVGIYGLAGVSLFYIYRNELMRFQSANVFFYFAALFFLAMILFDAFNARNDIFPRLISNPFLINHLHSLFVFMEEVFKFITEACLIVFLYTCLRTSAFEKYQG